MGATAQSAAGAFAINRLAALARYDSCSVSIHSAQALPAGGSPVNLSQHLVGHSRNASNREVVNRHLDIYSSPG